MRAGTSSRWVCSMRHWVARPAVPWAALGVVVALVAFAASVAPAVTARAETGRHGESANIVPQSGTPGTTIMFSAAGWDARTLITLKFDGAPFGLGGVVAAANGTWYTNAQIPAGATGGAHGITVAGTAQGHADTLTIIFTVLVTTTPTATPASPMPTPTGTPASPTATAVPPTATPVPAAASPAPCGVIIPCRSAGAPMPSPSATPTAATTRVGIAGPSSGSQRRQHLAVRGRHSKVPPDESADAGAHAHGLLEGCRGHRAGPGDGGSIPPAEGVALGLLGLAAGLGVAGWPRATSAPAAAP